MTWRHHRNLRICALALSGLALLGPTCKAAAAPLPAAATSEQSNPSTIAIATTTAGLPAPVVEIHSQQPAIASTAAVVMDLQTGTIVYTKNPLARRYPASLTKIMTALLALKLGRLSDVLTTGADATNVPPDKLYLVPGERESLGKLLYGLLLISANDAAVVIADHYGKNSVGFSSLMNREAAALGATHTHFVNANGLPDARHVTTAYDLALITRAAMQFPTFRRIVDTRSYDWRGKAWSSHLTNINHMLFDYPDAIGVKTGWTSVANETLAVAATRGGQTFLAILLDAPTGPIINQDATNLLNFAFAHYRTYQIVKAGSVVDYAHTSAGTRLPLYATRDVVMTASTAGAPAVTMHALTPSVTTRVHTHEVIGALLIRVGGHTYRDPLAAARPFTPLAHGRGTDIAWLVLALAALVIMLRYNRRHSRRAA